MHSPGVGVGLGLGLGLEPGLGLGLGLANPNPSPNPNQEEKAAELKERDGDLVTAIHLYLKGGLAARAASVVNRYDGREAFSPALLDTIANALFSSGMYERAGQFFERLSDPQRAMEAYRKGQAFGRRDPPPHLPHISPYLPHISPTSRLYLAYISL